MNNDRPEAGLLSLGILRSDPFMCLFLEALDFDFLSRIRFAMLYETPHKMNPVAVVKISQWFILEVLSANDIFCVLI